VLSLRTADDLYRWTLIVAVAYLGAAYLIGFGRAAMRSGRLPSSRFATIKLFDGATFAASLLLLIGVADPAVFALIGNTKPFLVVSGLAGTLHTLHELFAPA
jgi:hypothetical protein